jgi:guanidinopropionase
VNLHTSFYTKLSGFPLNFIKEKRGKVIGGGDVACLMPTKDNPNKITSQVAMVMMFELLSLVSLSIRNAADA